MDHSHEAYSSQVLDHLGLVAGMFEELGIDEVIDEATQQNPEMRIVTAGQAVKAMVLNGLGFINQQLYLQRFSGGCDPIAAMPKPAENIGAGDGGERGGQGIQQVGDGPGLERAQERFHFRPAVFDRVQVRRIGGQKQDPGASGFNGVLNGIQVMNRHVIHHHNLAPVEGGYQELFDKVQHRFAINRAGDTQARAQAIQGERPNGGHVSPAIPGHGVVHPVARRRPAIQPGQAQVTAHLVQKDVLGPRERPGQVAELFARLLSSLTGDQTFFLRGSWSCCRARQIVGTLTRPLPCSARSVWHSANVTSGCSATVSRSNPRSLSVSFGADPPPWRGAKSSPVRCNRSIFLINVFPT
jgi:hypothetical protein